MIKRLLVVALMLTAMDLAAGETEIATGDSIFAVITHKAGFASGVAHNHLIAADGYRAKLSFDQDAPLATRFELKQTSDRLVVDSWDLEQAWWLRLMDLGILEEGFGEVGAKDREKIRKAMLSKGQLDASGFPEIAARITEVEERALVHNGAPFPYVATLELEVRGRKVAKPVAARYELTEGKLTIEAFGTFLFTDFGIEPYSAFFGAVKNEDAFHVYVNLTAVTRPAAR